MLPVNEAAGDGRKWGARKDAPEVTMDARARAGQRRNFLLFNEVPESEQNLPPRTAVPYFL